MTTREKVFLMVALSAILWSLRGQRMLRMAQEAGLSMPTLVITSSSSQPADSAATSTTTTAAKYPYQTRATNCPTPTSLDQLKPFRKSQFAEDEALLRRFEGLCGGSYIKWVPSMEWN
jgi:tetrahydromethanopterin S-methyltransferase subunit H